MCAFRLITSEDLKEISKGVFPEDFDPLLDDILIPAVGESFAHYCNRPDFDKKSRTEFFSPGEKRSSLFLSSPPVDAGIQVWESSEIPRSYTALLVEGSDYFLDSEAGIIERGRGGGYSCAYWRRGSRSVKATYNGGYLTADAVGVPADLRLAAITQCKIYFDQRDAYGVTGKSLEGGSITLLSILTLPQQVTILLDRYRLTREM